MSVSVCHRPSGTKGKDVCYKKAKGYASGRRQERKVNNERRGRGSPPFLSILFFSPATQPLMYCHRKLGNDKHTKMEAITIIKQTYFFQGIEGGGRERLGFATASPSVLPI